MPTPARPAFLSFLALAIAALGLLIAPARGQESAPSTQTAKRPARVEAVKVRAVPLWSDAFANDQMPVAVILEHAPKWHTWPAKQDPDILPPQVAEFARRTEILIPELPAWIKRVAAVQYPPTELATVADPSGGDPLSLPTYSGQAVAFVPIVIAPDAAPGPQTFELKVKFQACDDKSCQQPTTKTLEVTVNILSGVSSAGQARRVAEPELFKAFRPEAFAADAKPADAVVRFNAFGWTISVDPSGPAGLATLLLLAAFGGLLLNFTPCVLPVIPIKILGLSQSAGSPARCMLLGAVMSLGVVLFWLGIGLAMAFISGFKAINTLFQTPWFSLAIGLFMFAMAAGMLGAFIIRLPNWVYSIDPSRESVPGALGFGMMTAVLSTPCTAPFMGAAAAWAATQKPIITLSTLTSIGAGMAIPYLVLSANPKLLSRLPRSGPGSELLKQVMGLFILAVAVFFAGLGVSSLAAKPPQPASLLYWWGVAALVCMGGVWIVAGAWRSIKGRAARWTLTLLGVLVAIGCWPVAAHLTDRGPINWVYYTPQKLAEARAAGKVVVMDFTADWCLNCKAQEAAVLHQPEIVKLLNSSAVVPLKIDLTGDNPDGRAQLEAMDWVGIPLLAIMGPGTPDPIKFDAYTPDMVRQAIAKATQPSPASPPGPAEKPGGP
jgi:thiol:disulfide interchange protein DsbD